MKIGIVTEGDQMNHVIPEAFETGKYLLIYETDDNTFYPFLNPEAPHSAGLAMVEKVIQEDCEALISGSIDKPAFERLASAQITRYDGSGLDAARAIHLMDENKLEFFRVPRGEVWTPHDHDHSKCDCGIGEDMEA